MSRVSLRRATVDAIEAAVFGIHKSRGPSTQLGLETGTSSWTEAPFIPGHFMGKPESALCRAAVAVLLCFRLLGLFDLLLIGFLLLWWRGEVEFADLLCAD